MQLVYVSWMRQNDSSGWSLAVPLGMEALRKSNSAWRHSAAFFSSHSYRAWKQPAPGCIWRMDGHNTWDNLYEFNFKIQLWKKLETIGWIPPHRYRQSVVVFDDNMFIFGGVDKPKSTPMIYSGIIYVTKLIHWQGRCVTDLGLCWYNHQFMVGSMYNWEPSM